MKKTIIILFSIFCTCAFNITFAEEKSTDTAEVVAPKWEDYVVEKYQNPRSDFKRTSAYWEMAAGFILTDFIITAPIGIPLIVHSATKVKNISYSEKKKKFEKGLIIAESIDDAQLKQEFYKSLIKDCKLSERKKKRLAKKRLKKIEKEAERAQKQLEKENKSKDKFQNI